MHTTFVWMSATCVGNFAVSDKLTNDLKTQVADHQAIFVKSNAIHRKKADDNFNAKLRIEVITSF